MNLRILDFVLIGFIIILLYGQGRTNYHLSKIEPATAELIDGMNRQIDLDILIYKKMKILYHADSVLKDSIIVDLVKDYHNRQKTK